MTSGVNGREQSALKLDDIDFKLVRYLQEHPRASYARLAREFEFSEPTAKRRLMALIGAGVIKPVMFPSLEKLGFTSSAWIGINVDQRKMGEIAEKLTALPETTMVCTTLGEFDVIAFVAQPSLEKLSRWVTESVATIEGVKNTQTFVATKIYKVVTGWRVGVGPE